MLLAPVAERHGVRRGVPSTYGGSAGRRLGPDVVEARAWSVAPEAAEVPAEA